MQSIFKKFSEEDLRSLRSPLLQCGLSVFAFCCSPKLRVYESDPSTWHAGDTFKDLWCIRATHEILDTSIDLNQGYLHPTCTKPANDMGNLWAICCSPEFPLTTKSMDGGAWKDAEKDGKGLLFVDFSCRDFRQR